MKSRFSIWASRGGTVYIPRGVSYGTVRGYTVPVRRTHGPYPRTEPTHPADRTHGTYPLYIPVPTPKSYPVLGSPGTR